MDEPIRLNLNKESKHLFNGFCKNDIFLHKKYMSGYNPKESYFNLKYITKGDYDTIIDIFIDHRIDEKYHNGIICILNVILLRFIPLYQDQQSLPSELNDWQDFHKFLTGCYHDMIDPVEIIFKANRHDGTIYDMKLTSLNVIYTIIYELMKSKTAGWIGRIEYFKSEVKKIRENKLSSIPLQNVIFDAEYFIRIILLEQVIDTRFHAEKMTAELFQAVGMIKDDSPTPYDVAKKYMIYRNDPTIKVTYKPYKKSS